jgi:FKBP-type peptidyl-prolyl cis-trans isomerase FkpA
MNKSLLVCTALLVLLTACNKPEKETPNGFTYKLVRQGEGETPKTQELIVFHYLIKDSKDSVWLDPNKEGFPGAYQVQDSSALSSEIGMQQMFRMLKKGDSVSVTKPVNYFFKNVMGGMAPPNIDTTLSMTCNLGVIDIMERSEFEAYQAKLFNEMVEKQKAKDAETLDKYLAEKKITAQSDTSGIRYVLHSNNGKAKPTIDNCVEVKYRGTFLSDGLEFDRNDKLSFPLRQVIQGWQLGIPKLGIGDSATLYIPSGLAYGPRGRGSIPPNAILVFDVQLLNIQQFDPVTNTCK